MFTTTTGFATSGRTSMGVVARVTAAVTDWMARGKARHQYREMLKLEEHLLHDIGVTRAEIRKAMMELDGR
jgi:uncharacterized protein YjiS (DUF1127 family)